MSDNYALRVTYTIVYIYDRYIMYLPIVLHEHVHLLIGQKLLYIEIRLIICIFLFIWQNKHGKNEHTKTEGKT